MSQISRIRSEGAKKGAKEGEGALMPKAPKQADHRRLLDAHGDGGGGIGGVRPSRSPAKFARSLPVHRLALMSETYFANRNDNHLDGFPSHKKTPHRYNVLEQG